MLKFGFSLLMEDNGSPIDIIVIGDDDEGTTVPTPGPFPRGNGNKPGVRRGFVGPEPIDVPIDFNPMLP
jgi:hypothetical protein